MTTPIDTQIGYKIFMRRKKLKMSQSELAKRLKLDKGDINLLEDGHHVITLHDVVLISMALECEPIELMNNLVVDKRKKVSV